MLKSIKLSLIRVLKKNIFVYLLLKYKTKSFKIFKLHNVINNLEIINVDNYSNTHDTTSYNGDSIFHFIFLGSKEDDIELKRQYVNPIFNLDFYKLTYLKDSNDDCVIHFCSSGFYNGNGINYIDKGYVTNLKETINKQFYRGADNSVKEELENNYYITDKNILVPYIQSKKIYNTDTIKVGVFFNDSFKILTACPYLRIHEPFKKLSKSKKFHFFIHGMDSYQFININKIINLKIFDIVIVERILPFLDILLDKSLKNNIKLIYETDDDLLSIREDNSSFEYINSCRDQISDYINASDKIVVTTPALGRKFDENKVEIIRNYYIDDLLKLKKFKKNNSNIIKIGYFGTLTHSNDLAIVLNVIKNLKTEMFKQYNINLEFVVIGGFNDPNFNEDLVSKIELPENSWTLNYS